MDSERELELLNAMAKGLREYLESTRGAHLFGANANVILEDKNLVITTKRGAWLFQGGLVA